MVTLNEINSMDKSEFVKRVGWIYENNQWIAEKAWEQRPFASIEQLHKIMSDVVNEAPVQRQIELICAHPDLGSRLKMNPISKQEQTKAGLNRLTPEEYDAFLELNQKYLYKFGFPFILAVHGHNKNSIYTALRNRLNNSYKTEFETALNEIGKISLNRLKDFLTNERGGPSVGKQPNEDRVMFYGKGDVFTYRTFATPFANVTQIPESPLTGKENLIFGLDVKVEIGGKQFLSSFTEGDNQLVVATDSMKNFIQRHLSSYKGSTIDGFLSYAAKKFLQTYPQMENISITGEEIPFLPTHRLKNDQLEQSSLVFKKSRNEKAFSTVQVIREDDEIKLLDHLCGIKDLQLIKIRGNSFVGYVQDEYTTLPEAVDRPLFIYLNISWKYKNNEDALMEEPKNFVLSEQITDIASAVFHDLDTKSIQHLIYQIGLRILGRFPQLAEVQFESQNRTWETVVEDIPDSQGKVYTEPRPPYGFQRFTVTVRDLENWKSSTT
jgi:urate oxidase / 2-oxo-4-hydroxy-4-carboxy-5-ureidoimidazoline decarboxylase